MELRQRFLPPEDINQTGPAALESAAVSAAGAKPQSVTSYWDLVYSSGRHNLGVTYWVVLEPPVSLENVDGTIHAIEIDAPDSPELFDLTWDREERSDIAAHHPDRVARMAETLETLHREIERNAPEEPMDPAAAEALRALGYIE